MDSKVGDERQFPVTEAILSGEDPLWAIEKAAKVVFCQAKIRKKSCKNPKFIFRKSEKNHKSFLPHEGMFHSVTFPLK